MLHLNFSQVVVCSENLNRHRKVSNRRDRTQHMHASFYSVCITRISERGSSLSYVVALQRISGRYPCFSPVAKYRFELDALPIRVKSDKSTKLSVLRVEERSASYSSSEDELYPERRFAIHFFAGLVASSFGFADPSSASGAWTRFRFFTKMFGTAGAMTDLTSDALKESPIFFGCGFVALSDCADRKSANASSVEFLISVRSFSFCFARKSRCAASSSFKVKVPLIIDR